MNTKTLKQLDILNGGLRLTNSERKVNGVMRFNNSTKKFEMYTGEKDIDDNEWINVIPGVASDTNLGNVKVGDNLFINSSNGKMNAISVGPSMFYQHVVTVSNYDIPFEQHISTNLPNDREVKGGSGDFTSITSAISFIQHLTDTESDDDYKRTSEDRWLILVAPGTYKENFNLLPYISIKGYGKDTTIIEPSSELVLGGTHITMSTDSSLMDLTLQYDSIIDDLVYIDVNSEYGRDSTTTTNFTNNILIKNVNFELSGFDSVKCVKLTKGNLTFEDSFISVTQDSYSGSTSVIDIFHLSGSTNLELISSKINSKSNHPNLNCIYSDGANITVLNSFIETDEDLSDEISSTSISNIFKSDSSDIVVRNSQLINNTLNGKDFDLDDSSSTSSTSMLVINDNEILSASISNNVFTLKSTNETVAAGIQLKLDNKRGIKMNNINYKVSHISYLSSVFTIKLDSDRNYSDKTFKYETAEDLLTESEVNIISSGGNKYVFNDGGSYNSDLKYVLNNGTYVFKNVPSGHPMAILNAGKTSLISYLGDASKKSTKTVSGTTADGTYDFYHGDITVTVSGDFGHVSVYCYVHQYMGGENLLFYGNTLDINILNTVSIANTYLRANSQIINCPSNNYLIETNNVTKEEADYNITGNSLVELNNYNVIHVSKDKGDFNTVSQALKSLGQIDSNLKYLIKVHTGVYTETEQIDLSNRNNINIIGDSKNDTEINFKFTTLPSDNVLFYGSDGNIENLKITFHNSVINDADKKVSVMKFVSKDVNIRNLSFDIISNNVNAIELSSCGTKNILENVDITMKYYFLEDEGGAIDKVNGLYCSNSNLIKSKNLDINISVHTTFKSSYDNTGKTIDNIYLLNSRIEGINTNLELTTELESCNLILGADGIENSFNNYIYGDSLILNSSKATNFILKNSTDNDRFIIVNCNILGDFSGNNIFTTGSVLTNSTDNEVHSYHTALLSNNKDSILIGNNAGEQTMGNTGERNILVGKESGKLIESGNDNISIGNSSGSTLVTKNNNTLIGNHSGKNLDDDSAVMIGYKSGNNATKKNLFVGTYSGFNITGENNVILGNNLHDTSSLTNKEIDDNTFIGNDAGTESSGNDNVFIGEGSGILDTGSRSVSIGNYTSSNNKYDKEITEQSTGYNVNIGYLAGEELITGTRSINIGAGAGQKNDQTDNIFVGYKTGNNVTGTKNIFMGNNSGENAKGSNNISLGYDSLIGNASESDTGSNNVAIGLNAGKFIKSSNNIFIGAEATSGDRKIGGDNIIIGYQGGKLMGITGTDTGPEANIIIGPNAGTTCEANHNIYMGKNTGTQNISGQNNVYMGYNVGITNTDNSNSVIIGYESGIGSSFLTESVLIGYQSGTNLGGVSNTAIGFQSCRSGKEYNTTLGYKSGMSLTGSYNTIIGSNSGTTVKSDNNVVVGTNALISEIDIGKDGNTVIGYNSGQKIVEGGNTYIGNEAGKNNAGTDNVIIGDNASVYTTEKATQDNVIIGKKAGENLNGNYNTVIGSNAGVSNITNQINNNLLMGYKAGTLNNKFNNLLVMGNNSGGALTDSSTYYDDIENLIIGNNSCNSINSYGNLVVGNNSGTNITTGENNTLIGEKTGDKLVSGSNNLFLGSSKSLIFQKVSTSPFDMSNTYYDSSSSDPIQLRWTSSKFSEVLSPTVVGGNSTGIIEFIVEIPSIDVKTLGLKSKTTLDDYRFNSVTPHTSNTNNLAMDLAGDTGSNQLKNKSFIRNFGGNSWGEYIDENNNTLVPELVPSGETFTSRQEYLDEQNTTNYKKNNFPIKFSPDDILEITFTQSSTVKNIIVKVYAIIQTIKSKDNATTIPLNTISISNLNAAYSSNDYEIMDERIYFDLLKDDSIGTTNFVVDSDSGVTIKHISSAGSRNETGSKNVFIGHESGNSNLGKNNLFLGVNSGKQSQTGNNNVAIGNSAGEVLREGENNTVLGDNAGKFISSTGNVVLGKEAGKNAETTSASILIGEKSGKSLSGCTNVIIGNNAGEHLTTNTNNILLGDNVKYNSTTGDNNVVIGNGIDSETANSSNMFMLGNKAITTVRQVGNAVHDDHIFIPVENVMCFTHDDLLRVYDKSDSSTFNYLNTMMDSDLYVKPHKSIIHTFPNGTSQLIKGADYVELRDHSLQLLNISFMDNSITVTDISGSSYDNKRPFITIERIGTDSNANNDGIYEIYKLPTLSDDGTYHTISMKKLKSDAQNFEITEVTDETTTDLANVEVRINNNVLVLSDNGISENGYGRYISTANIYGGGSILSITDNMIIERVVSGVMTDTSLTTQTVTNTLALTVTNASEIFKVGDTVSRLMNNNEILVNKTGFKILEVTSTTVKIHQYTSDSSINYSNVNNRSTTGHRLRLVKETPNSKQLVGNFNNNKLVVNGEKTDLESNASLTVNGSLALTDFLQLNASDGYANDLTLANGQSVIWLQEQSRSSYTVADSDIEATDYAANSIPIGSHIIKPYDLVLYETDGTAITGLSDATEYYVSSSLFSTTELILVDGNPAAMGSMINISEGGTGNHTFTFIGLTIYTSSSTSGDTYVSGYPDYEIRRASHGLNTGDLIKYEKKTGDLINSLTDDTEYYVIKVDTEKFKLAANAADAYNGNAISISAGTIPGYSVIRIMTSPQLKINYKDSGGTVHNKNIVLF